MAEGAPLLREYGPKAHRGFESHRLRQLSSLYGPLGPALVKFPTIFPTQLSGECFLVEGDGVGCTQLPLVGGQLPCLLFLKDTPPPSKFWLSRPHPGGTPLS